MTYQVVFTRSAVKACSNELPLPVVDVVLALIEGELAAKPRIVGKPMRPLGAGRWTARRGAYRIVYSINEEEQIVTIIGVAHRANIYRA